MTFKELRKKIAEKKKETETETEIYNPDLYWKGKKIIPPDECRKIANVGKVFHTKDIDLVIEKCELFDPNTSDV